MLQTISYALLFAGLPVKSYAIISGTVLDANTNQGIAQATVRVIDPSFETLTD